MDLSQNTARYTMEQCSVCGAMDGGGSMYFHSYGCRRDGKSGDRPVELMSVAEHIGAMEEQESQWASDLAKLGGDHDRYREALKAIQGYFWGGYPSFDKDIDMIARIVGDALGEVPFK